MRRICFLSALVILCLCACKHKKPSSTSDENVPAALQEKTVSAEIFTKRGANDDIVDILYRDIADTTPALKDFEKSLSLLSEEKGDSMSAYQHFNQTNKSYYFSAANYLKSITDSMLKAKMGLLINKSSEAYIAQSAGHEKLLASIDTKSANLNDLHLVLKLLKTLPVIEKYQQQNLPSVAALKKIEQKYFTTTRQADSLIGK